MRYLCSSFCLFFPYGSPGVSPRVLEASSLVYRSVLPRTPAWTLRSALALKSRPVLGRIRVISSPDGADL